MTRPGGLGRFARACALVACVLGACGRLGYDELPPTVGGATADGGAVPIPPTDGAALTPTDASTDGDAAVACEERCPGQCSSSGRCEIECPPEGCGGPVTCPPGLACDITCGGDNPCPDGVDCSAALECQIECRGGDSCAGPITCPAEGACAVACRGARSCAGPIDCGGDGACVIGCSGAGSCAGGVTCGAGACSVNCAGRDSCGGPNDCASSCACDLVCSGPQSCGEATCPSGCEDGPGCSSAPDGCARCEGRRSP